MQNVLNFFIYGLFLCHLSVSNHFFKIRFKLLLRICMCTTSVQAHVTQPTCGGQGAVSSSTSSRVPGVRLVFERSQVMRLMLQAPSPAAALSLVSLHRLAWLFHWMWHNSFHFTNNAFHWLYLKPIWTYNKSYHSLNAAWAWGEVRCSKVKDICSSYEGSVFSAQHSYQAAPRHPQLQVQWVQCLPKAPGDMLHTRRRDVNAWIKCKS